MQTSDMTRKKRNGVEPLALFLLFFVLAGCASYSPPPLPDSAVAIIEGRGQKDFWKEFWSGIHSSDPWVGVVKVDGVRCMSGTWSPTAIKVLPGQRQVVVVYSQRLGETVTWSEHAPISMTAKAGHIYDVKFETFAKLPPYHTQQISFWIVDRNSGETFCPTRGGASR